MKNTILLDTHRSGVTEMDKKKFDFNVSLFGTPLPFLACDRNEEHNLFSKDIFAEDSRDYDWEYTLAVIKRRREYSKTDEFRRVPIEKTDINWWRGSKEKRGPRGRRQQMIQYLIDSEFYGLPVSKPNVWAGFHQYEDPLYYEEQRTWKTDKKVKRQWMKHKDKKVENSMFPSLCHYTLFLEIYESVVSDWLIEGLRMEKEDNMSDFEKTYKDEIETELGGWN